MAHMTDNAQPPEINRIQAEPSDFTFSQRNQIMEVAQLVVPVVATIVYDMVKTKLQGDNSPPPPTTPDTNDKK